MVPTIEEVERVMRSFLTSPEWEVKHKNRDKRSVKLNLGKGLLRVELTISEGTSRGNIYLVSGGQGRPLHTVGQFCTPYEAMSAVVDYLNESFGGVV